MIYPRTTLGKKGDGLSAVKDFVLLYTNIDTITNKMHELLTKITETKAKIVAVVEIRPKNCSNQLSTEESNINTFQLFCELENGGRGVCIYVHQSLHAHICTNAYLPQNLTDTIFVEISNTRSKPFIVGVIYRSPKSSLFHSQNLYELIGNLHMCKKDIILVSDWNYPKINWKLKQSIVPPIGGHNSVNNKAKFFIISLIR